MLTDVAAVDYVATKWTPMAFRSNDEPVHLPCHIAGPFRFTKYSCFLHSVEISSQSVTTAITTTAI